ncbi:hypothetical protein AAHC03_013079 [Spirometra sp. Aus1]
MGTAVFSVHLSKEVPGAYMLCFKLLGQQCNKCDSKEFQSAIWYPEEVIRVLQYVHWQICDELLLRNGNFPPVFVLPPLQVLPSPPTFVNDQLNVWPRPESMQRSRGNLQNARTVRRSVTPACGRKSQLVKNLLTSRSGHPMKSHNSAQCEACQWGVCSALTGQEAQRSRHRWRPSRRRHREDRAQSLVGQVGAPPKPSLNQPKSSGLHSPKSGSEASATEPPMGRDSARNILELCLQMTCDNSFFGSARRAGDRRGVTFRSLRQEGDKVAEKIKGWKSADNLLESMDAFSGLNINV